MNLRLIAIVGIFCGVVACSSEDSGLFNSASLTPEQQACSVGVDEMIRVANEAVNDSNSREARRDLRKALVNDWIALIEQGEDPCAVYTSILAASTTF